MDYINTPLFTYILSLGLSCIFVFLYFVDSWRSPPQQTNFQKAPRVTGLLYILSGSILTALPSYFTENKLFIVVYLMGVVGWFFIIGLLLVVYSLICSYHKLDKILPESGIKLFIESIQHTLRFIQHGWEAYHDGLNALENNSIVNHCNSVISFSKGFYGGVVKISSDEYRKSLDVYYQLFQYFTRLFLSMFLHKNADINNYRVCILWFCEELNMFLIVAKVADTGSDYGEMPLPKNSLAGYALEHKNKTHFHTLGDNSKLPFFSRENIPFKSLFVRAICSLENKEPPTLVLSIDCLNKSHGAAHDHIEREVGVLSTCLAHAKDILEVSDEIIRLKAMLDHKAKIDISNNSNKIIK